MTTTKSSSKYPNKGPVLHKRVPKLSMTAGKYWRYYIPSETFFDSEDGNTHSLKLTFYLFDPIMNRNYSPPADYWIQFDHENQYLFALPTEKNVGKHKFTLVASNSKGENVSDLLEVHMRQHPSSRALHHTFTLHQVKWNINQYPLLIEAISKLARKTVSVFGDNNLESIFVQSIEHSLSSFTVSWTNSSLPAYPCPKEIIHSLYGKIADLTKPTEGISANPSRLLHEVTFPDFEIQGVGLRLLSSCSGSPPTEGPMKTLPSLRNPIDELKFKFGEAFRYEIRKDMFFFPRGGNIRDLQISLLTIDGHIPPRDGFIAFDGKKREIYGMALNQKQVFSNEFQIVARDPETNADISDAFVVNFEDDSDVLPKSRSFEISMSVSLVNEAEMNIDTKLQLVRKISSNLMSDPDSRYLRVLDIQKYAHNPDLNTGGRNQSGDITKNDYFNKSLTNDNNHIGISNDISLHDRFKREIDQQYYYELIWTNVSSAITNDSNCASEIIQDKIVNPIFSDSENDFVSIRQKLEPDFNLLHMAFKPMGKCVGLMSEREIGMKPIVITTSSAIPSTGTDAESTTDATEASEISPEEYVSVTAAIALAVIVVAFCCVILAILCIRFIRKQSKARFEVSNELKAERDPFLQKGRVPVILESEFQQQFSNQQRMMSPVIMPHHR
ncbi:dystroglycan-like protein [Leptotrombidium deliense]|uniref:Dystroglycan-like protein n=1 Tax=Leptotrombidium deliense TaxID=299467 RepID=A0A443S4H2_9ACAR|nr:dystroglycan-like protein [Leptotrombidium deliense]